MAKPYHFPLVHRGRSAEPRPQFMGRRQNPQVRQHRPQRQVNRAGEIRCWNCNRWGHYRSSCTFPSGNGRASGPTPRARAPYQGQRPPQVNAVQTSKNKGASNATPGTSSPLMYLALVSCILLSTGVDAQRPMVCQTGIKGRLFQLPSAMLCNLATANSTQKPVPATYQLFKQNLLRYSMPGYLCKAVHSKARLFTYLFGIEHLQEFTETPISVSTQLCQSMTQDKQSPSGPLHVTKEGVLQTQHILNWRQPSWTAAECCRWWTWKVTNYFAIPVTVYSRHGSTDFESTGADMSGCPSYPQGYCQIDQQSVVWTVAKPWSCQYLPTMLVEGHRAGNSWLAADGQVALTQSTPRDVRDCDQ